MAARASLDRRGRRADLAAFHRFRERGADDGPCQLAFPPDPRAARAAPYPRADDAHRRRAAGAAGAGGDPRHRLAAETVRLARTAPAKPGARRSEEHTSELQSLMPIAYAVFCLEQKK